MDEKTKQRLAEEKQKKDRRTMWEQIGRLGNFDPSTMVNLPELGR